MDTARSRPTLTLVGLLFFLPATHPLLIPMVGVPSHLLWFVHVLPVAFLTYGFGRPAAFLSTTGSVVLVVLGEKAFGAGYGVPADWETAVALAVALLFTTGLVAGFALYARRVTLRHQLLFQGVTLGVLRTDPDGTIQAANPAATEILDAEEEAVKGREVGEILRAPDLQEIDTLERGGEWAGRVEVGLGGTPRSLHVFLVVVPLPGNAGHQILLSDRSIQVLQERELQRRSKLATLGEALAGVAHELNNPLTVIQGHARLGMDKGASTDERVESLEVIEEQAQRMQGLIRELLGFSRSDEAEEETEIHSLLRRIMRVQAISLPGNVMLRDEIEWEGTVRAQPDKVEQIVLNLVSNAVDAMEGQEEGEIVLACRSAGSFLEIQVRDGGPGIPGDLMDRIFQPFVSTKSEGEGTGLGLAISRRLARSMDGDLTAENLSGAGACFTLQLPMDGNEEAGSHRRASRPDRREPAPRG